jgi:hypothetical protein
MQHLEPEFIEWYLDYMISLNLRIIFIYCNGFYERVARQRFCKHEYRQQ